MKVTWENYRELNTKVERTVLWFKEDDIFGNLRVMVHYQGGKIEPIGIDDVSVLQALVSKIKRPVDDERIKKMGLKIAELNKKLKNDNN